MTDVPRRSFPMVVAPPGGFEDAVKRGRRLRRRRAGGTTGAALALVGALMYTTLDNGAGSRSLEPTTPLPTTDQTYEPGGASPTPSPEPSGTPASSPSPGEQPGSSSEPGPGGRPSSLPEVPGDPVETTRPPRDEGNPKVYARRNAINEGDPSTTTSTPCPPNIGTAWCAYARATTPKENGTDFYELEYTLCRQVDALDGWVDFGRVQEADFSATDKRHDEDPANDDTVWKYSAGQPVVPAASRTEVPAGNCVTWSTLWDGYDDFGANPAAGSYVLWARSTGTSDAPLPAATYPFEHG